MPNVQERIPDNNTETLFRLSTDIERQLHTCMSMYTAYTNVHAHAHTNKRKTHKLNKTFSLFKANAGEIGDSSPSYSNIFLLETGFSFMR